MGETVSGMSSAMKNMDPEKIAKVMDQFEKQFEDMDVRSQYMEQTMESTTAMSTPPDQVDSLIQMVADEHGLKISGELDSAGPVGSGSTTKVAAPKSDLEARLAELRK